VARVQRFNDRKIEGAFVQIDQRLGWVEAGLSEIPSEVRDLHP